MQGWGWLVLSRLLVVAASSYDEGMWSMLDLRPLPAVVPVPVVVRVFTLGLDGSGQN